jgi:YidC/Oxa1 family membrane protein insertase
MGALSDIVVNVVNMLYEFTGNYGISIILMTVLVRLVILPFNISSMKFTHISKKLTPEMEEIKKKYKDDKDKQNQATVELWQKYKVNPLSGCLPMLIQLPILFMVISAMRDPALYQVSEPMFLGLNLTLPETNVFAWNYGPQYLVLPLLSVITTYTSSKIMAAGNQQSMGTMTIVMTLLMGWITLRFPSGLALYWVVGNFLQIGQHLVFNKVMEDKEILPAEGVIESEKKRNKKR